MLLNRLPAIARQEKPDVNPPFLARSLSANRRAPKPSTTPCERHTRPCVTRDQLRASCAVPQQEKSHTHTHRRRIPAPERWKLCARMRAWSFVKTARVLTCSEVDGGGPGLRLGGSR
eukprot:2847097-Rhodomonas_salina.8